MTDQPTPQSEKPQTAGSALPSSLPTAVQQRLQQVFGHAKRCYEKGDFDYAHDLFTQCVTEDPGNLAYLQHFRANVAKRSGGVKKSGSFGGLLGKSARSGVDKAVAKGKLTEALTAGCNALKKNAGDIGVLQAMAAAVGSLDHSECQLYYLRWALDTDATDIETNRQAAAVLSDIGEYDQAISCWRRVQQQKPHDEESAKQIARLSVEKTIHKGGYDTDLLKKGKQLPKEEGDGPGDQHEATDDAPSSPQLRGSRVADLASKNSDGAPRTPDKEGGDTTIEDDGPSFESRERACLKAIAEDPENPQTYLAAAGLYGGEDRLQDAERLLNKGLSATQDPSGLLRDRLEEVYLRRVHRQVEIARGRAEKQQTPEAKELLKRMADQANRAELEVYAARASRAPGDTRLQFELGVRQKRMGHHREAIKAFQAARGDSKRAAETQIFLGECFQHIEQYKLALSSYEAAVEAAKGGDESVQKLALYRTGVLATGMKDLDRAEQRLTELAALDFSYRDVADRLDKIAAMRNDG